MPHTESRSFDPEPKRSRAMEFKPIDPRGLSQERFRAEVAKGINAIHICVHEGQRTADQKREVLANDVAAIKGSVETLTDLFSQGPPAVKAKMGWLEHLKIAGSVAASLGLAIFIYQVGAAVSPHVAASFKAFHLYIMSLKPI
jgi:hypothetical protein